MARKKKQVKVTNNTPLKYEGTVTIKKIKNGKVTSVVKKHNQGYLRLFKFLLNCLCGDYNGDEVPSWAVPVVNDNGSLRYVGTCENISSKALVTKSTENYYVEYKFYFPWSSEYITGFDYIYIYPGARHPDHDPSSASIATYDDALDMGIAVNKAEIATADEDILIIWQLKLLNKE